MARLALSAAPRAGHLPYLDHLPRILPNSITPLIVQVSLDVGGVILTLPALSFLGLGAQDPAPTGADGRRGPELLDDRLVGRDLPGLAILVTAFAFTLLGGGLRDLMDPKRIFLR